MKCCSSIKDENECKSSFYHLEDKKYKCLYEGDKCKSSMNTESGEEAKLCDPTPTPISACKISPSEVTGHGGSELDLDPRTICGGREDKTI